MLFPLNLQQIRFLIQKYIKKVTQYSPLFKFEKKVILPGKFQKSLKKLYYVTLYYVTRFCYAMLAFMVRI